MKLPNGWAMPQDVEGLIDLLNTYGGTCYHEHAVLLRAFFDRRMGLPPSDGLEWKLMPAVDTRPEAERKLPWLPTAKRPLFNEDTLRDEITRIWGEHGAHAEVYDAIRRNHERYRFIQRTSCGNATGGKGSDEECYMSLSPRDMDLAIDSHLEDEKRRPSSSFPSHEPQRDEGSK